MPVIRRRYDKNFTIIPNEILNHAHLSAGAKGLLCYALSRPDDWEFRHDQLRRALRIGKKRFDAIIEEIIKAKYAIRDSKQGRDEQHRFTTYNYTFANFEMTEAAGVGGELQEERPPTPLAHRQKAQRQKRHRIIRKEVNKDSNNKSLPSSETVQVARAPATRTEYTAMGLHAYSNGMYPVYEHSNGYEQWRAFRGKDGMPPFDVVTENGKTKRVVWMTSLYPPHGTSGNKKMLIGGRRGDV